jgi:hypothetical protein
MNLQTYPVNTESVTGKKKHRLPLPRKFDKAISPYQKRDGHAETPNDPELPRVVTAFDALLTSMSIRATLKGRSR